MEKLKYPKIKREDKKSCKLNEEQIKAIKIAFNSGQSMRSLARDFNVSKITIKYWVDENYREKDKNRVQEKLKQLRKDPEKKKEMNKQRLISITEARQRIPSLAKYHKKELELFNEKEK